TPEERLRTPGIELPPAPPAVGDYTPTVIAGNLLFMSGQLPWIAGDLKFKGKMGAELNIEQGCQAFRLSALNAISQFKAALGNLDHVKQIVRLRRHHGLRAGLSRSTESARRGLAHRQSGIRAARPQGSGDIAV